MIQTDTFTVDPATLVAKERMATLMRERKTLREQNGIAFYVPHRKQDLFHRAGNFRFRYVRTGNRFGKSDMGAAEDVAWALGERPWYDEDDPARYEGIPERPTKGLVICADWDKATEIFTSKDSGLGLGKIFKFLPKHAFVTSTRNHAGAIDKIVVRSKWGGHSTIYFDTVKSYMQNPMGHESSNWDWIHVDEPCPHQMWKAVSRGLIDTAGSAWFACTPITEPWINDFFIPSRRAFVDKDAANVFNNRWVVVGSSRDNPYLSEEAIAEYESGLTPDERRCRIEGIPLAMSGLVYKGFKHEEHVYREVPKGWKDYNDPPQDYTVRYAIDPHPKTPHAVLFAATAPTGEVFFFAELFRQCHIATLAGHIKSIVQNRFVLRPICDPIAFQENPIDGRCMADEFEQHGVCVERAPKQLEHGILAVTAALKAEVNGHRQLQFSAGLDETIYEFDHYMWDQKRENKPVDKDDHMMENLYRLVLTGLSYIPPDSGCTKKYFAQTQPDGRLEMPGEVRRVYSDADIARMSIEDRWQLGLPLS